jgi:hypothetical protein
MNLKLQYLSVESSLYFLGKTNHWSDVYGTRAHQSADGEGVGSEATRQCCHPRNLAAAAGKCWRWRPSSSIHTHTSVYTVCAFLVRLRETMISRAMANESPNARQEALALSLGFAREKAASISRAQSSYSLPEILAALLGL